MNYILAISLGFPDVQCHATGDAYADIVWDAGDPIPSQSTLDQWIESNSLKQTDRHITVLAFRNRFTLHEKVMLSLASIDDPSAPLEDRMNAACLRIAEKDADTAAFIDLNRPDTIAGVRLYETLGVIAAGRADEILNSPILDIERPVR